MMANFNSSSALAWGVKGGKLSLLILLTACLLWPLFASAGSDEVLQGIEVPEANAAAPAKRVNDIRQLKRSKRRATGIFGSVKQGYCIDMVGNGFSRDMQVSLGGKPYRKARFLSTKMAQMFVDPIIPPGEQEFSMMNTVVHTTIVYKRAKSAAAQSMQVVLDDFIVLALGDGTTAGAGSMGGWHAFPTFIRGGIPGYAAMGNTVNRRDASEVVTQMYARVGAPFVNELPLNSPLPPVLKSGDRSDLWPSAGPAIPHPGIFSENREIPTGDSVLQQIERYATSNTTADVVDTSSVDLVILGGCAGDIRVSSVLAINAATLNVWISVACRTRLKQILRATRKRYPNAAILVHGYHYPLANAANVDPYAAENFIDLVSATDLLDIFKTLLPVPFATDNLPTGNGSMTLLDAVAVRAAQAIDRIHAEQRAAINALKKAVPNVFHILPAEWIRFSRGAFGVESEVYGLIRTGDGTVESVDMTRPERVQRCSELGMNEIRCTESAAFHPNMFGHDLLKAAMRPILKWLFPIKTGITGGCPGKAKPRSQRTYS